MSQSVLLLRLNEIEQSLCLFHRIRICLIGKGFEFDAVVAYHIPRPSDVIVVATTILVNKIVVVSAKVVIQQARQMYPDPRLS